MIKCKDERTNLSSQQWIQELPVQERKVGLPLFRKKSEIFPSTQQVISMFKDIRRFYGFQSGMSDILRNSYPKVSDALYRGDYHLVVHLASLYSKYEPLDSWEKVFQFIEEGNTHRGVKPTVDDVRKGINLLKSAMRELSLIDVIFREASHRQGVQVIYGGDIFLDYYNVSEKRKRPDSGVWNATRMESRIPLKFATAVLPLGDYEKQKLLYSR